jgi:hypothetical protein
MNTPTRILVCCLFAALFPLASGASPARIPDDLPLDAVKWTGGFWQDRMQRLRDIHLPGVLDGSFLSVENGSTFLNLLRAARLEAGGAQGSTWSDGDCREARFAENAPILSAGDGRVSVSMIPYYARLNRKSEYFRIWLPVY